MWCFSGSNGGGGGGGRRSERRRQKPSVILRPPKVNRDGYPPIILRPKLSVSDEINFYVPPSSSSRDADGGDGEEEEKILLACTLVRYLGPEDERRRLQRPTPSPKTNDEALLAATKSIDTTRPVIVICHGAHSWRNQMLLHHLSVGLSERLECHAIRFDFRGNGHSSGDWRFSGFDGERKDLERALKFVEGEMGCKTVCLVGHSKGVVSVLRHAASSADAGEAPPPPVIPCFVNLAGRYYRPNGWNASKNTKFTPDQLAELERTGEIRLPPRGDRVRRVLEEDVEERRTLDTSSYAKRIVANVLTIHGDNDRDVNVSNSYEFHKAVPNHEMKIVEGADHSFNGIKYMGELVDAISEFVRRHCGN